VELDRLNRKANEQTVQLNLDYTLSDPARGDRMFFRSDHASYMRHGIPVIWYYTGSDNSYHTPGDDIARIDFEKMVRITQLGLATAWQVAQLDRRVSADKTNWPALQ
jgi:Zn-dependent M28 family amino/carboxypeptidase